MRLTLFASIFATAVTMTLAAATVHPAEPSNALLPAGGALVSTNANNENPQSLLKLEQGAKGTEQQKEKSQLPLPLTTTAASEPVHPVLVRRVTAAQARALNTAYRAESTAARRAANAHTAVINDPTTHPNDVASHTADRAAQQDIMTKADHKARGQLAHANMLDSQAAAAAAGAAGDQVGQLIHTIDAGGHQATRDHHLPAANNQVVLW
ncbi:hypothetical protein FRB91_007617 [Serendipita sp. 411]|nr:hypothetical protein FRB91_007617 [Serendipita sp. 411]